MLPTDCLHLLTIDFDGAPASVRGAFAFSTAEQRELLLGAGKKGIPLLVLGTPRAFHLVSTSQHHVRAFRPALMRVQERTSNVEGAQAVPVRVTRGGDAARQFLRYATPFTQPLADAERFIRELQVAAALSTNCGAFRTELSALQQMAEHTAERINLETQLGNPSAPSAERELETLAAERILEEEILTWQSSDPTLRASVRPPLSESDIELFSSAEPESAIRLRVTRVLSKLRAG